MTRRWALIIRDRFHAWQLVAARYPRLARGADLLCLALIAFAVVIEITDGFRGEIAGVRVSVRSAGQILTWAAALALLRQAFVPRRWVPAHAWDHHAAEQEVERLRTASAPARETLIAALVISAAAVVLLWPQFRAPYQVPDPGDPLFSVWRLAWVAHQLRRDPLHLFDANIFHPHVRTLAYSDAMLLPALVAAPFLWLGVHQLLVYTGIFVAAIITSGIAMFVLVRTLTGRFDAALIASLLFAFCAFRLAHYSHLELQVTVWMPLTLLWLHRLVVAPRLKYGILLGLAIAAQALSSLYYGVFLVYLLAWIVLVLRFTSPLTIKQIARPAIAGAVLTVVLMVPVMIPFLQNRSTVGERGTGEVQYYSATPGDYLMGHQRSLYARDRPQGGTHERDLFPGIVPTVLAAAGAWAPFTPIRLAYGVGLAAAIEASFGFNGYLYHPLYRFVLPFRGLRVPARFGIIVALTMSVLAGFAVARIGRRIQRAGVRYAFAAATALALLVEARPQIGLEPIFLSAPTIYSTLPSDPPAVIADLPFPDRHETFGDDYVFMYLSTFHWHRLINGASGFFPADYNDLREVMYGFPSEKSLAALRQRGAEYLVVNGRFYEFRDEYNRVTDTLERRKDIELLSIETWEGAPVRLYRLLP